MNIVSRGGSLVFAWMCMTGEENPFYEHYDEILDICEEYDVTISLVMHAALDVWPMLPMYARLKNWCVLENLQNVHGTTMYR